MPAVWNNEPELVAGVEGFELFVAPVKTFQAGPIFGPSPFPIAQSTVADTMKIRKPLPCTIELYAPLPPIAVESIFVESVKTVSSTG